MDLHDAYISVKEALIHAGIKYSRNIEIKWVDSENIENEENNNDGQENTDSEETSEDEN